MKTGPICVRVRFPGGGQTYDYLTLHPKETMAEGDRVLVKSNTRIGVAIVREVDVEKTPNMLYSWLLSPIENLIHEEMDDINSYLDSMASSA